MQKSDPKGVLKKKFISIYLGAGRKIGIGTGKAKGCTRSARTFHRRFR
jgi:hypothetical protein